MAIWPSPTLQTGMLQQDPSSPLQIATKEYVDARSVVSNPEAPNDGRVYGRQGSTTSWLPVLPLTGGTIARDMTSTATDSNLFINATAVGSGVDGPTTAQLGLNVQIYKDNWTTTPAVGEVDGVLITCRQGGTGSDGAGLLINVENTGQSYLTS